MNGSKSNTRLMEIQKISDITLVNDYMRGAGLDSQQSRRAPLVLNSDDEDFNVHEMYDSRDADTPIKGQSRSLDRYSILAKKLAEKKSNLPTLQTTKRNSFN